VLVEPPEVVGGEIEADGQPLLAQGVDEQPGDVLAVGRVQDAIVGGGGLENAEARVMRGGKDHVFGAGELTERGPLVGVEQLGVKGLGQFLEKTAAVVVIGSDQ